MNRTLKIVGTLIFFFSIISCIDNNSSVPTNNNSSEPQKEDLEAKRLERIRQDSIYQAKQASIIHAIDSCKKVMRYEYDDMNLTSFFYDKSSPRYLDYKAFYAYIGKSDNATIPYLNFVLRYAGDDWLFVRNVQIRCDNRTFTITEMDNNFETEVLNNGNVAEWIHSKPSDSERDILEAVASSNEVKIRFNGQTFKKDWTLSQKEIKAMKNVMNAYTDMGGI